MKFFCTQENINRGLNVVAHIASRNVNLPILHNVLIEATNEGIILVTTNLEIGVRVRVRGKVEQEGSFTVPAQVLANYTALINAERIDIEQQGNELIINTGDQKTKIKGESTAEFPLVPEVEKKDVVNVLAGKFKEALAPALVAVSHDDSRPELTGVCFILRNNKLILAATDSYRLVECVIDVSTEIVDEKKVIIPATALAELARILVDGGEDKKVQIFFSENQVLFISEEIELTSRLIEGNFPDYEQIIPQQEHTAIIINREEVIKGIKAAGLFSRSGIHDINLHFSLENQTVTLSTVNNQVGENVTKIKAEIKGESNNIVFNHRYLLDGLTHILTTKTIINIIDNASPGVLKPQISDEADGRLLYIIMPIKQ